MQTLIIDGLVKTNGKDILWSAMPNNAYFLIRNRTLDSTLTILQNGMQTLIKANNECAFFVKDKSQFLRIFTNAQYSQNNITNSQNIMILNGDSDDKDNTYFIVNVCEVANINVSATLFLKSALKTIPSESAVINKYLFNTLYPAQQSESVREFIVPNKYIINTTSGRGFLIKNLNGVEVKETTQNIYLQSKNFEIKDNLSVKDLNIEVEVGLFPYSTIAHAQTFNDSLQGENFSLSDTFASNAFIFEPSLSDDLSVLNNKTFSQIQSLNKTYIIENGVDQSDTYEFNRELKQCVDSEWYYPAVDKDFYKKYVWLDLNKDYSLGNSRMWNVSADSKYQLAHNINAELIKSVSFTMQTKSQQYPYTIAFSAPTLSSITFLSDSSCKVCLGNRECLYNGITHLNLMQRYAINYEAQSLVLYINGVAQIPTSQISIFYQNSQINTFGLDVKDSFKSVENDLSLKLNLLGNKNVSIESSNDLNDYHIKIDKTESSKLPISLLSKIDGVSYNCIPFGTYLNNHTPFKSGLTHIYEAQSKDITSADLNQDNTQITLYAIGTQAQSIEIIKESIQGLIKVSSRIERAFNMFENPQSEVAQTYRIIYTISQAEQVNGTAQVKIGSGDNAKTIAITTKEF